MHIVPPGGNPPTQEPQGEEKPMRLPSLRTYELRRFDPDGNGLLMPETVMAHGVETVGDLLRFLKLVIDPEVGPREIPVLAVNGWYDYKEVWVEPSRLMIN